MPLIDDLCYQLGLIDREGDPMRIVLFMGVLFPGLLSLVWMVGNLLVSDIDPGVSSGTVSPEFTVWIIQATIIFLILIVVGFTIGNASGKLTADRSDTDEVEDPFEGFDADILIECFNIESEFAQCYEEEIPVEEFSGDDGVAAYFGQS
jgi:hypothetical protein